MDFNEEEDDEEHHYSCFLILAAFVQFVTYTVAVISTVHQLQDSSMIKEFEVEEVSLLELELCVRRGIN